MRILLVDDDESLMASLAQKLVRQRYAVDIAVSGSSASDYVDLFDYDLIVLDLVLPDGDGIVFCRQFRQSGYVNPLMILTAKASTAQKVSALDAGADDYVIKPFDFDELCARIRALLRREQEGLPTVLSWGAVQLDPSVCEVTYDSEAVRLTPKELSLMELFLRHPYRVHSLDSIIDDLWSLEDPPSQDAIRTHVKGLRRKLQAAGAPKDLIKTVYGLGYRLNEHMSGDYRSRNQRSESQRLESQRSKRQRPKNQRSKHLYTRVDRLANAAKPQANLSPSVAAQVPTSIERAAALSNAIAELPYATCRYLQNAQQLIAQIEDITATLLSPCDLGASASESALQVSDEPDRGGDRRLFTATQMAAKKQARMNVHKLAGSLGSFGLSKGSQLAQKIEAQFNRHPQLSDVAPSDHSQTALSPQEITLLIQQLRQYIDAATGQACTRPAAEIAAQSVPIGVQTGAQISAAGESDALPTLLIISKNGDLIRLLTQAATAKSFKVQVLGSGLYPLRQPAPDVVIWDVDTALPQASSASIKHFKSQRSAPIIALTDDSTLTTRRCLAAQGVRRVISAQALPVRIVDEAKAIFAAQQKSTVLNVAIAGDDPQFLERLQASVSASNICLPNICLRAFPNAQALWQWLHAAHPPFPDAPLPLDILILDIEMTEINGIQLCRVLRTDTRFQQLPIIFLTIHDSEMMRESAFHAGADDFMSKAIATPQTLAHLLQSWRYRINARKAAAPYQPSN